MKGIHLDKKNYLCYFNIGLTYNKLNMNELAIKFFQKSAEIIENTENQTNDAKNVQNYVKI